MEKCLQVGEYRTVQYTAVHENRNRKQVIVALYEERRKEKIASVNARKNMNKGMTM